MLKRAFDLVVGSIAAALSAPVVVMAFVVSAVVYRARPWFSQIRVGRDGRPFRMVKIRSLPVDVPSDADKYQIDATSNHRWGRWIRSRHVDELPQLWAVVTGSMSLVGPRPEMLRLAEEFDRSFAAERSTVRPGCTGLWQISGASTGLIREHPEFDLHYVRNRTIRLDLWILWTTIKVAVTHHGMNSLEDIPAWTGASVGPQGVGVRGDQHPQIGTHR